MLGVVEGAYNMVDTIYRASIEQGVLAERGLAAELNGRVALCFEPSGLVCELAAPLPHVSA